MSGALTAAAGEPTAAPRLIGAPERRALGGEDQRREQLDSLRRLLRLKRRKLRPAEHRLMPLARNGRGLVLGMLLNIINRSLHAVVCRRKTAGLRDGPQPTNESTIPGECQGLLAALNAAHWSLPRRPASRSASFALEDVTGLRLRLPRQARNPCFAGDYRGSRFFRRRLVSGASISSVPRPTPHRVAAGTCASTNRDEIGCGAS